MQYKYSQVCRWLAAEASPPPPIRSVCSPHTPAEVISSAGLQCAVGGKVSIGIYWLSSSSTTVLLDVIKCIITDKSFIIKKKKAITIYVKFTIISQYYNISIVMNIKYSICQTIDMTLRYHTLLMLQIKLKSIYIIYIYIHHDIKIIMVIKLSIAALGKKRGRQSSVKTTPTSRFLPGLSQGAAAGVALSLRGLLWLQSATGS